MVKKPPRHKWLRMDEEGDTAEVELGKYALTHRLGIQIRDLRLLDAQAVSSPPAILCRDQAIVVNLEFLKCIITTRAAPPKACLSEMLQESTVYSID